MTCKGMNRKIVEKFPELQARYIDETSWQEGDETGSHVVFGGVFTPYFEQNLRGRNFEKLAVIFAFIEEILARKDVESENVIALSVISGNESDLVNAEILPLLGVQTKKLLLEMMTADMPSTVVKKKWVQALEESLGG